MAEIERCLKRLYSYLVKSDYGTDYEEGKIDLEKKTICKFSPVGLALLVLNKAKLVELYNLRHISFAVSKVLQGGREREDA